jgi:predicted aconitase with swiveling domain
VGRDARVISEAAVLSSIEGNNLEGFRLMMKRCCGSCITSSVSDRITTRGKDDFWLVVNDIQALACI